MKKIAARSGGSMSGTTETKMLARKVIVPASGRALTLTP